MARTLQYSSEFADELREDLEHLHRVHREEWIDLLDLDLVDLERELTDFPAAGRLFATRGRRELRRIRLRRTPFVVWYVVEPRTKGAAITLLHLFHVRQRVHQPRF